MSEKDTPFITGQSPSMRRARAERENPSPAPDPEMIAALSQIAEREHAIAAAYRAAAEAGNIGAGAADRHADRAAALATLVSELGAAAPDASEADPRSVPVSADEIRYLGSDPERREALERDERAVGEAYDAALAASLPESIADRLRAIRG